LETVSGARCCQGVSRRVAARRVPSRRASSRRARGRSARAVRTLRARAGGRASPVGISESACVGERAGVETHRKPGEVVICRVQKKVHRDTAPPMAAQMG
jgi:hypothetical protein